MAQQISGETEMVVSMDISSDSLDCNLPANNSAINCSPRQKPRDSAPPSSTGPSSIEGDRKRKMVVSSNVPPKKHKTADSVDNISSILTEKDVKGLFGYANISSTDYDFLVPSENQRANWPPGGYISVYASQITSGLRFPMHDMVERVCNVMQVSPSQLVPNSHRMIVAFIFCATFYGIPLTEGYFFSLFKVGTSPAKGLFQFSPIQRRRFLHDKPTSFGIWKNKFFFLRPKGSPWNCTTEWRESFSKPTPDASLAVDAIEKGLSTHHFQITKLTCKDILVCGGIEPGVPSPQFTFRDLMQKASLTKFDPLPEDNPFSHASMGSGTSSAHPSIEQPLSHRQSLSTPNHTEIPSQTSTELPTESTDVPGAHYLELESKSQELSSELTYSKSRIEELEQELELSEARRVDSENKSHLANEALKNLRKRDTIRESELAYAKLQIGELQQELQLSEARSMDSENKSHLANEALENLMQRFRSRDSELASTKSLVQELQHRLELSESARAESETKDFLGSFGKRKEEFGKSDKF